MDKHVTPPPTQEEMIRDLVRLTHGSGLTVERVAGSTHLASIPWLKEQEDRSGSLWPTLIYLLLRDIVKEYEGGIGPRSHALQAAYNVHPDISGQKLEGRRLDIAHLMGLNERTIARYVAAAQPAVAASLLPKPGIDHLDRLLGDHPRTVQRRLHVRRFVATLFLDTATFLSKIRLEYQFVARTPNFRRTRITSLYERIDAPPVGAAVSHIEGAELLEEFTLPNGGMVHRIEFPRALNPGDEQTVIVERNLSILGPLKRKWLLASSPPVEKVTVRVRCDPHSPPTHLWTYEGIEYFRAPTAYSEDAKLTIDRLGNAEWNTKLLDTSNVCGVAWE